MNWIEITTRIGCKNMCSYCPQSTLLNEYMHPKKIMTLDDFITLLPQIDKSVQIHFSGFSESFLNDDSHLMMLHAYKNGYQVVLYTTLEGVTDEKINVLANENIRFEAVHFHEYDGIGFELEKFNNTMERFKSKIQSNMFKIERITNPMSRGGNNFSIPVKYGKLTCNRFYCNVLLPNGEVFLCCSDWKLTHRIGNLYAESYLSNEMNSKRDELKALAATYDSPVLCRTCEFAQQETPDLNG